MKQLPQVSIIIVHYHVKEKLLACIESIKKSKPNTPYEIIVVDNDEKKKIKKDLLKKFPEVKYIENENKGFGEGNNIGAVNAKGKYLFFLNPDTLLLTNAVDTLYAYLRDNKSVGIVAPLLHGKNSIPYQQGAMNLTPVRAIVALSFLNKLFPNNPVSKKYFLHNWNKKSVKEVDVCPGTAFMISKDLFHIISGFDEKFFLYFEEFDLCKRVREIGKKIYILPEAKLIHFWGKSTKQRNDINTIFTRSRFYYFKKHYGLLWALVVESFLGINKYTILVFLSMLLGLFLASYKINTLMPFFSDIGWFYMSAKEMLQTGNIPLVGIPSSHPWLHQGALWTYLLAGALFFSPNPLQGAYLTIGGFLLTILLLYIIGKRLFSNRVGVISSILYSASPLVIMNARMPYHTSPIPLFGLLFFYTTVRWLQGNKYYFPISIFLLAVLYNFEIATAIFGGIFLLVILFGIWKKKQWVKDIVNKKIIALSLLAYTLPMLPMLIYDVQNNFPQTIRFLIWVGYRILVVFGYPELHPEILPHTSLPMSTFVIQMIQKIYFAPSWFVAMSIFVLGLIFLSYLLFRQWRKKKLLLSHSVLFFYTVLPFTAILAMGTVSEAYFPMLFPFFILCTAIYIAYLFTRKYGTVYVPFLIAIYIVGNVYGLIRHDYYQQEGLRYSDKIQISRQIVNEAQGKEYNLVGVGENSQFPSYTMPYQYLTWLLGNEPVQQKTSVTFILEEQKEGITILQRND